MFGRMPTFIFSVLGLRARERAFWIGGRYRGLLLRFYTCALCSSSLIDIQRFLFVRLVSGSAARAKLDEDRAVMNFARQPESFSDEISKPYLYEPSEQMLRSRVPLCGGSLPEDDA